MIEITISSINQEKGMITPVRREQIRMIEEKEIFFSPIALKEKSRKLKDIHSYVTVRPPLYPNILTPWNNWVDTPPTLTSTGKICKR